MVGAHKELLQQLSIYGNIIQCVNSYSFFVFNFNTAFIRWRMLDEYPHEEYTEVMWVQYERIDNARQNLSLTFRLLFLSYRSARHARKKMDDTSFFGLQLRIVYAPEYETPDDTWAKLRDRRNTIGAKLAEMLRAAPNPHQRMKLSCVPCKFLIGSVEGRAKRSWQEQQHQHAQPQQQPAGVACLDPLASQYAVQEHHQQQYAQQPPAPSSNVLQFTPRSLQPHFVPPSAPPQQPRQQQLPPAPPAAPPVDSVQQTVLSIRNKLSKIDKTTDPLAKKPAAKPPAARK